MHHNWVLWIRLECTRCMGFVVSWISAHSGEHNAHREDRNAPPAIHRFILVLVLTQVFSLQNDNRMQNDCSICVSWTWNEISIRFYLVPSSLKSACRSLQGPKNLLGLRKALEPVGHYYLCHVGGIHATKEYNAGSVKRDNIKKAS